MFTPRSYLFSRQSNSIPGVSSGSKTTSGAISDQRTTPVSPLSTVKRTPDSKIVHGYHDPIRDAGPTMSPSPPGITIATTPSSATTSDPVVIPVRSHHDPSRQIQRSTDLYTRKSPGALRATSKRGKDVYSPESIPPAVAALLAVTSIPLPKSRSPSLQRTNSSEENIMIDSILKKAGVSEKEISISFGKSPMDILLSPPEELEEDDVIESDTGLESYVSSRTFSSESTPSLEESSLGDSSFPSSGPITPARKKRSAPTRKRQPLSSPPQETITIDPLSNSDFYVDDLDFRVFDHALTAIHDQGDNAPSIPRRRSAFKSNLTASLRALKNAARSISNMTSPMITPDDFLTRSIISLDPRIPFTDERMPPVLDESPTPALRRYFNPTTNAPIEAHVPSSLAQATRTTKCTASIQMQTYKISKIPQMTPRNAMSRHAISSTPEEVFAEVATGPVARQRDMRENSDFIRIAVMEMMMRKHGKLDEKMPGRARWALPPRQPSTKVYEIGEDGIPVRWIATSA